MSSIDRRLLVIGLDGGTFDVFRPLLQQGRMPNLSTLLQRGCWGELDSTIPPFTASAWSTFITGQNPGRHGVLSFQIRDRYNYDTVGTGFVNAERFDLTLWQILSDAGKQLSVVNVPMTYPPQAVNGHMITGMLTPSTEADFVYPPRLKSRLGQDYIIDVEFIRDGSSFRLRNFPSELEMLNAIRKMTAVRMRTLMRLWRDESPWDFAMVVFTGTDRLFHFFWPYVEAAVGNVNAVTKKQELDPVVMDGVCSYLAELDEAIGQLVQAAGPEATILLMSDHGFGPAQQWRVYLNVWLEQLGMLTRRSAQGMLDLEYLRVWVGRRPWLKALLRRLIPQQVQDSATDIAQASSVAIIDWEKTQAFLVPIYFQVCGIEINQKGLFRKGIVEPGEAYERLRDRIIKEARSIRNPNTGSPVVQRACRREELYTGRYVETFPDVILILDPNHLGAPSMAGRMLIESHPHPMRSGEHRQNGMFAVAGPDIEQHGELKHLRLLDVPPTILHEMGVAIPDSFDGCVMTALHSQAYLDAHPIQYQSVSAIPQRSAQNLSANEQALLEERLRGLGYL